MSLSRKDYVRIAEEIKSAKVHAEENDLSAAAALRDLTDALANYFDRENPNFDRNLFIEASLGR